MVAVSFRLVDVHIAMVLDGDIIIDYAQDAMEQANVLYVMAQADTMKSNIDKEINAQGDSLCEVCKDAFLESPN